MLAPPLPHTPSNSHFVRKVKLRLAYRLAFVIMENPIKIDDLGVPLFLETPMYTYIPARILSYSTHGK